MRKVIIGVLALGLLSACSSDEDAQYIDVPLETSKPSNFPDAVYNYGNNPPTQAGFELGKKLFYEGRLSSDGLVSCGFCHIQADAFTHHGHSVSHGVDNLVGTRNTPPIQNMAFQSVYMWDGATNHLDLLSVIPFTSPIEMNGNFETALNMMRQDNTYRTLFKRAFPDGLINAENMLKALGQFMAMMVSSNSRFDHYRRGESGGQLTTIELEGYAIFNQKCASCHATDLFTDNSFRNNGLPINPQINDVGRYRVTELEQDRYKFKVPSLRNIEFTAPYMHDGRFFTLEAVLDHYSSGVAQTPNLDPLLVNGTTLGIPLTASEKSKLIAFLKTLTDHQYLNDPRFAEF
ncbi:cytochrome c peroxidase [Flavobacterium sp.]|uniref:cytochrome-c peroxidase n=1 Tax=Flavobacterium sp. TaxID=239 RepID=UPI003342B761